MNDKVTVFCSVRGGLQLRLHDAHPSDKIDTLVPGGVLVLNHGANPDVNAAFMARWQEENQGGDLLKMVTVAEQVEPEHGEPGVDNITERPDKEASITDPAPEKDAPAEDKPADA